MIEHDRRMPRHLTVLFAMRRLGFSPACYNTLLEFEELRNQVAHPTMRNIELERLVGELPQIFGPESIETRGFRELIRIVINNRNRWR